MSEKVSEKVPPHKPGKSDGAETTKPGGSRRNWKSFQISMKRYLHKVSPIHVLSMIRDCYVDSVTVAAYHVNDPSLIHGPHIGSLSHSASRRVYREEDDLLHMARTLSKRDGSFPRSVSYAGTAMKLQDDDSNWGRSRSHASVYGRAGDNENAAAKAPSHRQNQKLTTLSATHEYQ